MCCQARKARKASALEARKDGCTEARKEPRSLKTTYGDSYALSYSVRPQVNMAI